MPPNRDGHGKVLSSGRLFMGLISLPQSAQSRQAQQAAASGSAVTLSSNPFASTNGGEQGFAGILDSLMANLAALAKQEQTALPASGQQGGTPQDATGSADDSDQESPTDSQGQAQGSPLASIGALLAQLQSTLAAQQSAQDASAGSSDAAPQSTDSATSQISDALSSGPLAQWLQEAEKALQAQSGGSAKDAGATDTGDDDQGDQTGTDASTGADDQSATPDALTQQMALLAALAAMTNQAVPQNAPALPATGAVGDGALTGTQTADGDGASPITGPLPNAVGGIGATIDGTQPPPSPSADATNGQPTPDATPQQGTTPVSPTGTVPPLPPGATATGTPTAQTTASTDASQANRGRATDAPTLPPTLPPSTTPPRQTAGTQGAGAQGAGLTNGASTVTQAPTAQDQGKQATATSVAAQLAQALPKTATAPQANGASTVATASTAATTAQARAAANAPATSASADTTLAQAAQSASTTITGMGAAPTGARTGGMGAAPVSGTDSGAGMGAAAIGTGTAGSGTGTGTGANTGDGSSGNGAGGNSAGAANGLLATLTADDTAGSSQDTARIFTLSPDRGDMSSGVAALSSGFTGGAATQATATALDLSRSYTGGQSRMAQYPPTLMQVSVAMQRAVQGGSDSVTVQLKPEDLGSINVKLSFEKDGHVKATISADNVRTLDMLQRNAGDLQKGLQAAGIKADANSLNFTLQDGGSQQGQPQQQGRSPRGNVIAFSVDDQAPEESAPVVTPTPVPANGRVDVRI